MGQNPTFFAKQISDSTQLAAFWSWVNNWGFSGESAFCMVTIENRISVPFPLVTMQKAG